jgi:uncharacterized membrane protein
MAMLVLGLFVWVAAHLFKRLAPDMRSGLQARMGKGSKALFGVVILVSLGLIIVGYRGADLIAVYTPGAGMTHLNNTLMLFALVIYSAGMSKGVLWTRVRHPQLVGTALWAVAHLAVNGDLASVLLFGTMLVWAVATIFIVNTQEGPWQRPVAGKLKRDLVMVGGVLVAYGLIAGLHVWAGLSPFGG